MVVVAPVGAGKTYIAELRVSVITFPVSMTVEQVVDLDPLPTTPPQPSLLRRLYAYIQLLGHTLYHVFDGWRIK